MRKLSGVCIHGHSTRVLPYLFLCHMLILVFLGSPVAFSQQPHPFDTLSVLEFTAQPQHQLSVMEGNNLVEENVSNIANFQLADNQDYAVVDVNENVKKLP